MRFYCIEVEQGNGISEFELKIKDAPLAGLLKMTPPPIFLYVVNDVVLGV